MSKQSLTLLANICLILVIVFLLGMTHFIWYSILARLFAIALPFIVGFIIAYFMTPLTRRIQRLVKRKSLAIIISILIVVGTLIVLIIYISPQVYRLANDFYAQYKQEFDFGIIEFVKSTIGFDLTPIYDYATSWIEQSLADLRGYVELNIPSIIGQVTRVVVTTILGVAVALYLLADNGIVRSSLIGLASKANPRIEDYLGALDSDLRRYYGGLFLVCLERFAQYCLVYLVLGSEHWLFLGLLHGVSVFVPYIGGTLASLLGVISLMLAAQGNWPLLIFCLVILVVLQYVDEYYIGPKILSKRTRINPLWIIFVFFTGTSLLGVVGVFVSVPIYIIVSVCLRTYQRIKNEEGLKLPPSS